MNQKDVIELNEEAMLLVSDKDVCLGLVSTSRELHIGRVLKKEDEARSLELKRTQDLITGCVCKIIEIIVYLICT